MDLNAQLGINLQMSNVTIRPAHCLKGSIYVPGDKSISHRALLLGAIANGQTRISGLSTAADVESTKTCLKELGVAISEKKNETVVHGVGLDGLQSPRQILDAGNSGTTLRLLSGILAGQHFPSTIIGDESLRKRPMRRIIEPLELMGAKVKSERGFPPLTISGGHLQPIHYDMPIASAQVKSCVLLASLFAKGMSTIHETARSRDHTERMLQEFSISLECTGLDIFIEGPAQPIGCRIDIPGDISSAAFFLVAALISPNAEIKVDDLGLNPTRTGILEALNLMGAKLKVENSIELNREPRGTVCCNSQNLRAVELSGSLIPRVIDEIPVLAIAASQANGTSIIKNAKELRVKESDRIAATCTNLKRMGVPVVEHKDGMTITGPCRLKGAEIDSFGDHRIAMAFAVAGLIADGDTTIKNADCIKISFPTFFEILESLRNDSF